MWRQHNAQTDLECRRSRSTSRSRSPHGSDSGNQGTECDSKGPRRTLNGDRRGATEAQQQQQQQQQSREVWALRKAQAASEHSRRGPGHEYASKSKRQRGDLAEDDDPRKKSRKHKEKRDPTKKKKKEKKKRRKEQEDGQKKEKKKKKKKKKNEQKASSASESSSSDSTSENSS